MFDEKTIQEVAKATNTALEIVKGTGGFLDDVFGRTLRQLGAIPEQWAYLLRVRCVLSVAEKTRRLVQERGLTIEQLRAIDAVVALPLLDGASLEVTDEIQDLWAALIANAETQIEPFGYERFLLRY